MRGVRALLPDHQILRLIRQEQAAFVKIADLFDGAHKGALHPRERGIVKLLETICFVVIDDDGIISSVNVPPI